MLGGFDDYTLLCDGSAREPVAAALRAVDGAAEIADVSDDSIVLRVDGLLAADLPRAVLGPELSGLALMRFTQAAFEDAPVVVVRIGLAGEYGFLFLVPSALGGRLRDALRAAAPDARACGHEIFNVLQMETRSFDARRDRPRGEGALEAGLHWMIDFRKPDFVGCDAIVAAKKRGPAKRLVCVRVEGLPAAPRPLDEVRINGRPAGYVANAGYSYTLGTGIALAYLDAGYAYVGIPVEIAAAEGPLAARVVSAPFFVTRSNSLGR